MRRRGDVRKEECWKTNEEEKLHGVSASSPPTVVRTLCNTSWLFYRPIPLKVTSQMYHFMAPKRNQWLWGERKKGKENWRKGEGEQDNRMNHSVFWHRGKKVQHSHSKNLMNNVWCNFRSHKPLCQDPIWYNEFSWWVFIHNCSWKETSSSRLKYGCNYI